MLNCILLASKSGFDINVVRYPLNIEAPFDFKIPNNITLYDREDFSSSKDLIDLVNTHNPQLLFVSGWIDKLYLKVIRSFKVKSKIILLIDTPWYGTIKQKVWSFIFRKVYKKCFIHIWIPGKPQRIYAEKLGFSSNNIFEGLYTCNTNLFNIESFIGSNNLMPKRILFVGRYVEQKAIIELCENFININSNLIEKWQLWCVGTGNLWNERVLDDNIKHYGFVQPKDLPEIISKCQVYTLPSKYEPWGVSLHEMISMGKAVLVSDNVGSSYCFVNENLNGFVFSHKINNDFSEKLSKIMKLSLEEINEMGKESVHLSKAFTEDKWVSTLNNMYA
jgi:glycosyltransferase involved in cell wall biosynthesis